MPSLPSFPSLTIVAEVTSSGSSLPLPFVSKPILMVCVPFWLSTTSANGVLPSFPSLTIVVDVTSLESSLPSPFLSRPTLTVCVPSLLLTTSVNDDLPSSPLAPVAPVAPVAPSFTIVVEVTSLGSSLPSPFLSRPTLTV